MLLRIIISRRTMGIGENGVLGGENEKLVNIKLRYATSLMHKFC